MWDMAKNSIILFLQGRLFQDIRQVLRQICAGALFTALALILIMIGLTITDIDLGHVNVWLASGIAGFLGGMLQPYLFKDLKYA